MKTKQNTSSGKRTIIAPSGIILFIVILFWIFGGQKSFAQGVGISEASITADPSAILELKWTSGPFKGFLAPRLTSAQRNAIASPANGLLVYDTDTKSYWYWDVVWIAISGGSSILGVANGGTGRSSITANNLLYGNGTSPVSLLPPGGTTGAILMNTAGGAPGWSLLSGLTGTAGILQIANGGTNNGTLAVTNGGVVYTDGSKLMNTGVGTSGQILRSAGAGPPIWSTATYPLTTTINQLLYSSADNTIAGLATANNGVLITSAGGVPSIVSTLPSAVQGNITTLGTITSGTWNSTTKIGLAYGGTNTDLSGSAVVGDILFANTAISFARLAGVATGNALISGGVGGVPSWGKIGLTTHVSGILPGTNGGTGVNNGGNTITLGGNLTTSGAFPTTLTVTGATNVTLPTSGTLALVPQIVQLTADVTNNTTTLTDVLGISNFSLAANSTYYFKFRCMVTSNATFTGIKLTVDASAGVTSINYINQYPTSATAFNYERVTALTGGTVPGGGPGAVLAEYTIEGTVVTSAAVTLTLQHRSETNNTTTIKAGSIGYIQKIQ